MILRGQDSYIQLSTLQHEANTIKNGNSES